MGNVILSVYTRDVDKECYPAGLANSVHFSYRKEDGEEKVFQKNYGILFMEASITSENTIKPRGVKTPKLFVMDNGLFGICAEVIWEDGTPDESCLGKVFWWSTEDFIDFKKEGFLSVEELQKRNPHASLVLPDSALEKAILYWTPIENTGVELPEQIEVSDIKELENIKVKVLYNDGSAHEKKILWDSSSIDFKTPGCYEIKGKVLCNKFRFPLTKGYGDPVLLAWEGKWYFIATNDNLNDFSQYLISADKVAFSKDDDICKKTVVLLHLI